MLLNRRRPKRLNASARLWLQALEDRTVPAGLGWADLMATPAAPVGAVSHFNLASERMLALDTAVLRAELAGAPAEQDVWFGRAAPLQIELPRPDGTTARFAVADSPIMEPGLAAQFPLIKTYAGKGIDDPGATIRMDISPYGFNAVVLSPSTGTWLIAPYYHLQNGPHVSYFQSDAIVSPEDRMRLGSEPDHSDDIHLDSSFQYGGGSGGGTGGTGGSPPPAGLSSGAQLRTYRVAIAATGEYTRDNGGSVASAMSAIVTTLDQINGIFENDFTIRLVLVANNANVIYTDGNSDPYTNDNKNAMLGENQSNLDSVIGTANYDIGHVFSSLNGGGVAGLGVVGNSSRKGQGTSSYIDFIPNYMGLSVVPHEMGHQFNANHTFNSSSDSNRNAATAYENGSGSTVMSYAGLIGDDYVSGNNPQFNHSAIDEVIQFVDSAIPGVGARTATGNLIPVVNAGNDAVIPANTPFELIAAAADGNNDSLTYSWEERDLGPANLYTDPDNGQSPLFRVFPPTDNPSRTFPKLTDVINNTTSAGEKIYKNNRVSNYRVVVRDNRPGAGAVNTDDVRITVVDTGAPFAVVTPNAPVSWTGKSLQLVSWNVAGTNANGINAVNVRIRLSTDGGLTYPITILSSTPNDGAEFISVPNVDTSTARLRIEGVGSVFFDISDSDFSIVGVAGITVSPVAGLITTEAGGQAQFVVGLEIRPTASVTIAFSSSDPTEGTASHTSLTFTQGNWSIPRTITITGVDDLLVDGNIAYTIITGAATSGDSRYNGLNPADVSVTNLNDDVAGVIVTPVSGLETTEPGGTATFTVRLASRPLQPVSIPVSSSNSGEGVPNVSVLTFDSSDWSVPKTVTVTGVDDAAVDVDRTYAILLGAATSGDADYNGYDPADVSLVNRNDDTSVAVAAVGSNLRYGQANAFTATVQGLNGHAASGTVTFSSGALNLGTFPLVGGVASMSTTLLPIGVAAVTAVFSADPFFQPSSGFVNATILPALLTVQASAVNKVYGAPVPALPFTASGYVDGEGPSVFTGALATTALPSSPVGTFPITKGALSAGAKYEIAFVGNTLTVTPANLTITATPVSKVYGAAVPALPFTPTGFVNNDTSTIVTGALTTPATSASPVGVYAIQKGTVAAGANYTVNYVSASLAITPATVTVTPDAVSKQYGPAAVPPLTYTSAGFVNGDTAALFTGGLSTTATVTSVVGQYPISVGTLGAGANYVLSLVPVNVTVTPAPLTVTANDVTSRLGAAIPAFSYSVAGLQFFDTEAVVSGVSLTTPATTDVTAGTYPIVVTGGTASNYTIARVNGTITLTLSVALVGANQFTVGADRGGTPVVTLYDGNGVPLQSFVPFPGFTGGVRTATGDITGDGVPDLALGTGPGTIAQVRIIDGASGVVLQDILPFEDFTGGVFVSLGDLTGDKRTELTVTPDTGGGPRVSIYRGGDFTRILNFFGIDDVNFRGGARTAMGDINGDGYADLVIAAGFGGGPRVSLLDGRQLSLNNIYGFLTSDFFAFSDSLRDGVYVACGDVNGDGFAEVTIGAGPGGAPRVIVLSGKTLLNDGGYIATKNPVANFFSGDITKRNGVFVSLRNLDNDAYSDLVIGGGSLAVGYHGRSLAHGSQLPLFTLHEDTGPNGGVFVG